MVNSIAGAERDHGELDRGLDCLICVIFTALTVLHVSYSRMQALNAIMVNSIGVTKRRAFLTGPQKCWDATVSAVQVSFVYYYTW